MEGAQGDTPLLSYSHFRPVLEQRRQLGFSSPHLTLRILVGGQSLTPKMAAETLTCRFCIQIEISQPLYGGSYLNQVGEGIEVRDPTYT